jgi:hypothetical protein
VPEIGVAQLDRRTAEHRHAETAALASLAILTGIALVVTATPRRHKA